MTDEQQAKKYVSGLKYPTQEHMILHDMFSIDEAHCKTMKIERLQNSPFKSSREDIQQFKKSAKFHISDRPLTHKGHPYNKIGDDDSPHY